MEIIRNLRKAVMFIGDFEETGCNMRKPYGLTVQEYKYQCQRTRNSNGKPYGPTYSSYMELFLRNFSDKFEADLLRDMKNHGPACYTFLFNVEYDESHCIKNFSQGFIVTGFIVQLYETYSCLKYDSQNKGDKIIKLKIQLLSIKYLGNNNELILEINKTN